MAIYSRSSIQNAYYRTFWIRKTNALLNLSINHPDIDKIYLYATDPYEAKYQYLIFKREKVGLDHFNDPKAFVENSNDMLETYKNIEDCNPKYGILDFSFVCNFVTLFS